MTTAFEVEVQKSLNSRAYSAPLCFYVQWSWRTIVIGLVFLVFILFTKFLVITVPCNLCFLMSLFFSCKSPVCGHQLEAGKDH